MINKKCLECGDSFLAKLSTKKTCSDRCRWIYNSKIRQANALGGTEKPLEPEPEPKPITPLTTPLPSIGSDSMPKPMTISSPKNMDIHTQYVFDSQRKEIDRWENAFRDEKVRRQKLKEENDKLRNELAEIKTNNRIRDIEASHEDKPSMLGGLVQGLVSDPATLEKIMPHVTNFLGTVMTMFKGGTPSAPLVGLAPGEENNLGEHIKVWYASQSENVQKTFYEMLVVFSMVKDPAQLHQMLVKILSLLKTGSAMGGGMAGMNGRASAAANF